MSENIFDKYLFSPVTHLILYSLLLVFTPFIMLQSYLQDSVRRLSEISFHILGIRLPLLFTIALIGIIIVGILFRKKITLTRIAGVGLVAALILFGHYITDYYMGRPYYDLQNNWHYIAYSIFALLFYRATKNKGIETAKQLLLIYLSAIGLSTFDEGFQFFLSSRIFDIGDIAKDGWGVVIGLVIIVFIIENGSILKKHGIGIRKKSLSKYWKSPVSIFVFCILFNLLFIVFASLLTEHQYIIHAVGLSFLAFVSLFLVMHFTKYKFFKVIIIIITLSVVTFMVISYYNSSDSILKCSSPGITYYKNFPIPFFDILVFPDGSFRLVDKKNSFNPGDKGFLYELKPDILIFGKGYNYEKSPSFNPFVFNIYTGRATQIIERSTPEACDLYNKLSNQKKVLLVIHNS